jgi:hypothetical protein
MYIAPLLWDRDRPVPSGHYSNEKVPARKDARAGCLSKETTMTDYNDGGQERTDDEPRTERDGGEKRCEACGSLNNVFNGFVHDVADESWTDYDALCRDDFIEEATANDAEETEA